MVSKSLKEFTEQFGAITTPSSETAKATIDAIRAKVKKYVSDSGLKSLVIGVSGGLDSSVVAALCQEKYTGVPLIGISIPLNSSDEHKEQAQWVGKEYCSVFEEFDGWEESFYKNDNYEKQILNEDIFKTLEKTDKIVQKVGFNVDSETKKVLKGNMKARLRMITLYDLARKTGGMVMSTDNLSEYFAGFWTICGDVGDYGPIQNVGKGFELQVIARELGIREDIITQKPSDGLMVTEDNTDEAQLGGSYQEFDAVLFSYLGFISDKNLNADFEALINDLENPDRKRALGFIKRYESTKFKRTGTTNLSRSEIGLPLVF